MVVPEGDAKVVGDVTQCGRPQAPRRAGNAHRAFEVDGRRAEAIPLAGRLEHAPVERCVMRRNEIDPSEERHKLRPQLEKRGFVAYLRPINSVKFGETENARGWSDQVVGAPNDKATLDTNQANRTRAVAVVVRRLEVERAKRRATSRQLHNL